MRNVKRLLLTLFITPFLFVGCVSDKTSSIKPEITNEENITNEEKVTNEANITNEEKVTSQKIAPIENNQSISKKDRLLASAIFGGEIPLEEKQEATSIISNLKLTTQSLTLNNSWNGFSKEDEILETARKFLGVKYIWAANGPSAFDCSGFTKYVFKTIGISLPRYSGHQANVGEKIKFKNLEKGDLVFFDTEKKFTQKVNHVGIFIGDNKFIHASSAKKKVIITSFSKKKFYKNKFLYARRIVNANKSFALNISSTKKDSLVN